MAGRPGLPGIKCITAEATTVAANGGLWPLGFKGPDPSYAVLKCGDNCPSSKRDMAQNVNLQGHDLERSNSFMRSTIFCKTIRILYISTHVKFQGSDTT